MQADVFRSFINSEQVDDMGNPNKDKAMELVKMTAPDAVSEEIGMKAAKCVDMHGMTA